MKLDQRSAGVLLHITSLPGPHGIGDLGPDAHRFVDWLASAGQSLWQVLPTTPIGPGDSPYQSVSAFAGSPLMVALEPLVAKGWLAPPTLPADGLGAGRIDYGRVTPWRLGQLRAASEAFFERAEPADRADFDAWCSAEAGWLDDYVLFMSFEHLHGGTPWWTWPQPQRDHAPQALVEARVAQATEIGFWQFVQWCFDTQWFALKAHANASGIAIMGDLPIFIAHHSADCWARPDLYELGPDGQPTVVAGVPPDAFSDLGQRWGNPLYRWDRMSAEGHAWWIGRMRRALSQADAVRIDHFRGFEAYWEVPAASATAVDGRWVRGPGAEVFDALLEVLGPLPIVAEDLGVITPDVTALRLACGFPGMCILQFAFGNTALNPYLPHNHVPASVVYTGTHDNDTTGGWWQGIGDAERRFAASYLGLDLSDGGAAASTAASASGTVQWAMIRTAFNSVANTAIVPMQDVLGLDGSNRMNLPGSAVGNWGWRFDWSMVAGDQADKLARLTAASGRGPFALLGNQPETDHETSPGTDRRLIID